MISEGISNERMQHIIEVARQCYTLAKEQGEDEAFCQRMFMIGFLHDVGYEFSNSLNHAEKSVELLQMMGNPTITYGIDRVALEAIQNHGKIVPKYKRTKEYMILNKADMTIDGEGRLVTVKERIADIRERYGSSSVQLRNAVELVNELKLYS